MVNKDRNLWDQTSLKPTMMVLERVTGFWILGTGFWFLDTGFWFLDSGSEFVMRTFHRLDEHVDLLAEPIQSRMEIRVRRFILQ